MYVCMHVNAHVCECVCVFLYACVGKLKDSYEFHAYVMNIYNYMCVCALFGMHMGLRVRGWRLLEDCL